ncbi:MAG: hypothetical protein MRERV_14c052 [Mycoplasmataceae bacterium RV_VA103A]|nr:MAG: hypothetical protein MRERV_14c052 [Mycoplasmataceae bacterium RV_VA103A]
MTSIYQGFLKLAEMMNGAKIEGQFAKDVLWLIAFLFGFWLLVMLALTPYWLIKWMFNRK